VEPEGPGEVGLSFVEFTAGTRLRDNPGRVPPDAVAIHPDYFIPEISSLKYFELGRMIRL
jgi:hypothetical protein